MMNNPLLYLAIIISFVSCGPITKTGKEAQILNFQLDTLYAINSDGDFGRFTISKKPANSKNVYLLNPSKSILGILNLDREELIHRIELDCDFLIKSFQVNENDSLIYLFHDQHIETYNFKGQYVSKMELPMFKYMGVLTFLSNQFTPLIKDDRVYAEFFPYKDSTYLDQTFFSSPIEGIWNQNELELLLVTYPKNYQENCFGYNYIPERIAINDSVHMYSFEYSDSILIYNINSAVSEMVFMGSHVQENVNITGVPFDYLDSVNLSIFDELMYTNSSYYLLTHYPTAGLYSRLLRNIESRSPLKYKYVTILYSDKFEYIGETTPGRLNGKLLDYSEGLLSLDITENGIITLSTVLW